MHHEFDRRDFIKTAGTGALGLIIGFSLPAGPQRAWAGKEAGVELNAWLHVRPDNSITIFVMKSELGQNVYTTLPALIAEELDADWSQVSVEMAPPLDVYGTFGTMTVGSRSIRAGYEGLRTAGAAAREMLVAAAATQWGVSPTACQTDASFVIHKDTGRRLAYAAVCQQAAKLPVPAQPRLKLPAEFKILGRPLARLDSPWKVDGSAVFGIDVTLPGLLVAAVRTSPVFGGELTNFTTLRPRAGVHLVKIPGGVAAVAANYWEAKSALDELDLQFGGGSLQGLNSAQISATLRRGTEAPGIVAHRSGHIGQATPAGARTVTADYEVPYLAHATMEPMNCTAWVKGKTCELWIPTQAPFANKLAVANLLEIRPEDVHVHVTFIGSGFGRRSEQDFVVQAVLASKQLKRPVKVIWDREEDMRHDFYRPAFAAKMTATLAADGMPVVWRGINAGSSIAAKHMPDLLKKNGGIDFLAVEGFRDLLYAIPNQEIRSVIVPTTVPVGFWRSVGQSHNVYFVESFLDELAVAAGKDPVAYRRALLTHNPRALAVLELAAKQANWGEPLPKGSGRGIALAFAVETLTAQVAEVVVDRGQLRVKRVTCAYDCGPVVNPQTVEAQMQGGIIFGLSAALKGEITVENGRVQQGNFDDYRVLMLHETPQIDVYRVPSQAKIGGVGEAAVPAVAPAVANAVFAATGRRIRKLPLAAELARHT